MLHFSCSFFGNCAHKASRARHLLPPTLSGALSRGRCLSSDAGSYMSTRPMAGPGGPRTARIGLIAGDGIGEALVLAARKVLEDAPILDMSLDFIEVDQVGFAEFQRSGHTVSADALQTLHSCDGALFGAVCSPQHHVDGYQSPLVVLRNELDLFVNLRPLRALHRGIDALVVRENTEDLYVGVERTDGSKAVAERHITQRASSRAARVAFEQALERASTRAEEAQFSAASGAGPVDGTPPDREPTVCCVHKANILGVSDGLWLDSCRSVGNRVPFAKTVRFKEQLVDIALHDLILHPEQFDVVLCPNFYGDMVQDAGAALCGGLGVVPSANVGESFMLSHGSLVVSPTQAPDRYANPVGHIRSAAMVLRHLGESLAATAIERGVQSVLGSADGPKTPDLGGTSTGKEVRQAIIDEMSQAYAVELFSQGS